MGNVVIAGTATGATALPVAVSIDPANDYLPIYTASATATQAITRNTLLGVSGTPADLSSVQTFTNKVLGNTNTLTLLDGSFTLQHTGATTKQAVLSLASITAGQTRTYTLPDASDTIVTLGTTQTLTNKTLTTPTVTSPVLTGGTIDNSTITVDTISGHTSPTIVTVGGVQFNNGVVSTASAVTSTSVAASAIQPQALLSGTGSSWVWQSYTPALSGLSLGNGTLTASYIQIGKTVFFKVLLVWGTTTTASSTNSFGLPVTSVAISGTVGQTIGFCKAYDGTNQWEGPLNHASTTTAVLRYFNVSGSAIKDANITSTSPNTWATGAEFYAFGHYEAA